MATWAEAFARIDKPSSSWTNREASGIIAFARSAATTYAQQGITLSPFDWYVFALPALGWSHVGDRFKVDTQQQLQTYPQSTKLRLALLQMVTELDQAGQPFRLLVDPRGTNATFRALANDAWSRMQQVGEQASVLPLQKLDEQPSTATTKTPPAPRPILRVGATGTMVEDVQRKVAVDPDGRFGPNTYKAVLEFQTANKLKQKDGVVGPETWAAFDRRARPVLRVGSVGPVVLELQQRLNLQPDGKFGTLTRNGVIAFQTARRLKVDGVVGPETWKELERGTPAPPVSTINVPELFPAPTSSAPAAPTSSAPAAPTSSAPAAPTSSAPAAPTSSAPAAPTSSAPAAPTSSAPAAPTSSAPAAPTSSAPGPETTTEATPEPETVSPIELTPPETPTTSPSETATEPSTSTSPSTLGPVAIAMPAPGGRDAAKPKPKPKPKPNNATIQPVGEPVRSPASDGGGKGAGGGGVAIILLALALGTGNKNRNRSRGVRKSHRAQKTHR
jgi:peptidoglycan hydrolase-like protein with peptidoglycan-binding domain